MIPPRPWRSVGDHPCEGSYVADADGMAAGRMVSRETADLIVRLVNAEPEIVAALEASARAFSLMHDDLEIRLPKERLRQLVVQVRAAQALLRGERAPAPPSPAIDPDVVAALEAAVEFYSAGPSSDPRPGVWARGHRNGCPVGGSETWVCSCGADVVVKALVAALEKVRP